MLMAQSKAKDKKLRVLPMYTLKVYNSNYFRKPFYKKMKK